jgi:hypothetical protein
LTVHRVDDEQVPLTGLEAGVSDLIVDYQVLEQSEQLLTRLNQQISGSSPSLAVDSDWGFGGVTSAMGGFHGDWSYHRKQILDRMERLHTMSRQSRQAFQGADAELASQLTKSGTAAAKR